LLLITAKEFYEKNGHLQIDRDYVVQNVQLGRWIETQRYARKGVHYKITAEQIKLLDEIGMLW
jgi:hypothetical protein